MPTLTLHLDEALFKKLQKHATDHHESTQEFTLKAVCDALNMWDDFYELDNKLEQDLDDPRPDSRLFNQI